MPSIGSITKTIRLNAEDREYVESLMSENGLTWSGAIHKVISERGTLGKSQEQSKGTPNEIDECVLDDMRVMASFSGVTLNKYLQMLCDAMNEGRVIYEDGEFRAESEIDLSKFKEACDGRGLKYQKMIDKCAQIVWQS